MPGLRSVRRLRLKAPTSELARHSVILLEDALHTATLPVADDSRLWIVRHLSLGRIDPHSSAQTIALLVERRARDCSWTAVHADEPYARDATVVYFRDSIEPYRSLARRLFRGERPGEWFWKLALPFWNPASSPTAVWRRLFFELSSQPVGIITLADLFGDTDPQAIISLVRLALLPEHGPQLLNLCGWSMPARAALSSAFQLRPSVRSSVSLRWKAILSECSDWGTDDARLIWLAALALIAAEPARLSDPGLVQRAVVLLGQISGHSPERDFRQASHAASPLDSPVVDSPEKQALNSRNESSCVVDSVQDPTSGFCQKSTETFSSRPLSQNADIFAGSLGQGVADSSPASTELLDPAATPSAASQDTEFPCAGLFLLIQILERLGIRDYLKAYPQLIDLNLPNRLFLHFAQRLQTSVSPSLFPVPYAYERDWPRDSLMPAGWLPGLARKGPLKICRVPSLRGTRLLSDSSGALILAYWQRRASGEIARLLRSRPLRRGRYAARVNSREILLDAWFTAARRWCRRVIRTDLRTVVLRSGTVSATRTHLDITFDLRHADIRIREAGLDLDPGWVPWLGKVVHFHYE